MRGEGPRRIVIATRNRDKAQEIRAIFAGSRVSLLDLSGFPEAPGVEETGETLEANALLKARSARKATGEAAIADDSGLFVDALDGRPGVRSSRYAGEEVTYAENNARLLVRMKDVPDGSRGACFRCIVALVDRDGAHRLFRGEVAGVIARAPEGEGGFGYDPLFIHPPSGTTFARLGAERKNRISHRFLAFSAARRHLELLDAP